MNCGGASCKGCLGRQPCSRDSDCIAGSCNDEDEDPPKACAAAVSFERFPFIAPDFGRVSLAAGDFDDDQAADVFVAHEGSSTVDVYPSAPDIILGAPRTLSTEDGPIAITVRDFNGDDILDFAIAYRGLVGGNNGVQVFRSGGGQPFDRHDSYLERVGKSRSPLDEKVLVGGSTKRPGCLILLPWFRGRPGRMSSSSTGGNRQRELFPISTTPTISVDPTIGWSN